MTDNLPKNNNPKLKWWQLGILIGILFPGLIVIFYFKGSPITRMCNGSTSPALLPWVGLAWPLCILLASGLFLSLL